MLNLADLLTQAAHAHGDDTALVEAASGRRMTWAEVDDEVDRVAGGYADAGLVAGHRVMIALGNRIEFVTCYLAALRAQLVAVPVNPRSSADDLARMLADSGSRLLIADSRSVTASREAVAALDAFTVRVVTVGTTLQPGEHSYDQLALQRGRALPPLADAEALAVLLYTSGASGRPRAAMLTHRALLANIAQIAAVQPPMLAATDVVLGVLPLFHVYGLNAVLGATVGQAARLVIAESFDPDGTLDLIDDEAVSVVPVAPPVFAHWLPMEDLALRLGSVRLVLSGSAAMTGSDVDAFAAEVGVGVHQGYGLTEAAPVVTSTLCSKQATPGSLGAPLPGIEVRLVDDGGLPHHDGDPGEIEIRGDNLFSGYWPDGEDGPDAEGWWRTGDVGFIDDDGDLFLVDRRKDVVTVSGFRVYPVEVEVVLAGVPGVREVAVVGVPDAATGEAVVAYLVADGDPDEVRAGVTARAEKLLARFKQPTVVHLVPELPHTATGQVQKGRLRAAERRRVLDLIDQGAEA
ncbi:class I adenylate-forming enzyme family protein [Nocardioides sp. Bht2]|uniref:class I adenylate-forming enzyme family protein n=1 Tax=Nocardioides sp. Bht2 TaxID=3392297 RepID=UPI0039B623C3